VFLDACYPGVAFHSPTEGRDGSSSCYATRTSLYVSKVDLKSVVKFVTSV
jgi:hypothetical protein